MPKSVDAWVAITDANGQASTLPAHIGGRRVTAEIPHACLVLELYVSICDDLIVGEGVVSLPGPVEFEFGGVLHVDLVGDDVVFVSAE